VAAVVERGRGSIKNLLVLQKMRHITTTTWIRDLLYSKILKVVRELNVFCCAHKDKTMQYFLNVHQWFNNFL
jgi:hypothetical protein